MKFLKTAAATTIFFAAVAGAQTQNTEQVKLTKYSAFIESDYGLDITLKPDGKAVHYHWGYDNGKKVGGSSPGTWTQEGDKVTLNFKYGKLAKTMVYQIKTQNNPTSISMDCKGPYGLTLVSEKGSKGIITEKQLWPASLIKSDGPCVN